MLLPWEMLSVLRENLRVRVEEGGKVYGNSDQGCGPQKQSPSGHTVVVLCPLPTTKVPFLFHPCQVPLNRVTSAGQQESLTYCKEDKNMSLELDTSDLKLGITTSLLCVL